MFPPCETTFLLLLSWSPHSELSARSGDQTLLCLVAGWDVVGSVGEGEAGSHPGRSWGGPSSGPRAMGRVGYPGSPGLSCSLPFLMPVLR